MSGLTSNRANLNNVVVDFRDFYFEESTYEIGMSTRQDHAYP